MDIVVSGTWIFKALGFSRHLDFRTTAAPMIGRIARPANVCRGERIFLHNPRPLQKYCKFSRSFAFLYRRVGEFGKWSAAARPLELAAARGDVNMFALLVRF